MAGDRVLPVEMTAFVGRRGELAAAKRLLESARVVTLTGEGGVGKTRLALQLARQLTRTFRDGVRLVELAHVADPDQLPGYVAEAVGIREMSTRPTADTLIEHLHDRQLLVVMDNCEHLGDAVGQLISALLPNAGEVRVLATSRHSLGVPGERRLRVPPMSVPRGDPTGALTDYESVALLADRAEGFGFTIDEGNRDAVVRLCQLLDGIPLAIELAAVRLEYLSAGEVVKRLGDRFQLLNGAGMYISPGHHHTLEATIDWSHNLCTPAEQRLWARLSVFSGGFDLDAVEAVCSDDGSTGIGRESILNLIAGLLHKSILAGVQVDGQHTRYRMLETIREYGRNRLAESGEQPRVRRRHRDYYYSLVQEAASDWFSPREHGWMHHLARHVDNVRVALHYCLSQPGEARAGLDMAINVSRARGPFFVGGVGEWRRLIDDAVDACPDLPQQRRIEARAWSAWLALCQGDAEITPARLGELDPNSPMPIVAFAFGAFQLLGAGSAESIPLLTRAREGFRVHGDHGSSYMAAWLLGMAVALLGSSEAAHQITREVEVETDAVQAGWASSWSQWLRGLTELLHGDPHAAAAPLCQSLQHQHALNDQWGPSWGVEVLAWATVATGETAYGARLLGAAHKMRQLIGIIDVADLAAYGRYHAEAERHARRVLGEQAYTRAYDSGFALTWDAAIRLAIRADDVPIDSTVSTAENSGVLTARERDVAALVAEGLSNKGIANRLVISTRTAETHVRSIIRKLGVHGRAQVAAWVAQQRSAQRSTPGPERF